MQEKIEKFFGKIPENSNDYGSVITNWHLDRLEQMLTYQN